MAHKFVRSRVQRVYIRPRRRRRVPIYIPYPVATKPQVIKVEAPQIAIPSWVAPVTIIGLFGIIIALVATRK